METRRACNPDTLSRAAAQLQQHTAKQKTLQRWHTLCTPGRQPSRPGANTQASWVGECCGMRVAGSDDYPCAPGICACACRAMGSSIRGSQRAEGEDLQWRGGGENVKVLWLRPQQQIPDCATHQVALMACTQHLISCPPWQVLTHSDHHTKVQVCAHLSLPPLSTFADHYLPVKRSCTRHCA